MRTMNIPTPKTTRHVENSAQNKRYVTPPIGLHRPAKKDLRKDEVLEFTLRTNPTVEASPSYKLTVPFFSRGTPEELLLLIKNLRKVISGQNATNGASRYALTRRILQGDALAAFNKAAEDQGTETNEHFEEALKGLISHVFPTKALTTQKRYMRRFLRKPREMKIREFMNRVVEINEYLPMFPPYEEDSKLSNEEIMDIAEYATPAQWQKTMVMHGFDPITHTPTEFVEFCERLEYAEPEYTKQEKEVKTRTDSKNSNGRTSGAKTFEKGKRTRDELYCEYHGVYGHDTGNCKVMIAQAKKMRSTWESRGRNNNNTTTESKNKTWKRNDQAYVNNKKEVNMHEIVKQTLTEMFQADKKKIEEEVHNLDLDDFKNATLSESEMSNGEESA